MYYTYKYIGKIPWTHKVAAYLQMAMSIVLIGFSQLQVTTVFPNFTLFTQPPSLYLIRYYVLPRVYIYVHTPSVTWTYFSQICQGH